MPVAGLLFLSGMCALVYQVVWFREFRLVFGASTAASAAVLAIFMGGLGVGNALLGKRADRQTSPLAFYARLEFCVAVAAAATPLLVDLVRTVYIALGGQLSLGLSGATAVRLLLSAMVLGVPTVLMGGTLPAAARAVTTAEDQNRRRAAVLYGANTLGAVAGASLSTFFALEAFGTRTTLWLACLVNLLTSLAAFVLSGRYAAAARSAAAEGSTGGQAASGTPRQDRRTSRQGRPAPLAAARSVPASLVYVAAGVVGFAFFLMELVWYRMLGPLLGGTTFTFGLILAVALLGIGLGGAAYAVLFGRLRATLGALALTCGLEAALVAFPLALGDRVAIWTAYIQEAHQGSFSQELWGWAAIASLVILPAAILSGLQFPLLIALLGRGDAAVGEQIGRAVACNTVGAILGSLAGGFGLLPLLSAPGAWRAVVVLLAALCAVLLAFSLRIEHWRRALLWPAASAVASLLLLVPPGPSVVWRHAGIGAGRARLPLHSVNGLRNWEHNRKRNNLWQADGVESSVAIVADHGLAFVVNGKSDGNAIGDACTQIMLGLLGGILHPEPKTAFVVGLGTGETAGWLAEMPSAERVDVVELEPALDEMARRCAAVNHDVLHHPKVCRIYNDAREVLLTSPRQYDLIVSEPSNPYRSGVAGLFTREFYAAGRRRLREGGLFLQWLQGYEVDDRTVRTVIATLQSVYPHVEVWQTGYNDMLLVGSGQPLRLSAAALRQRIAQEPFQSGLAAAWRAEDLEAVLARYVGGPDMVAEFLAQEQVPLNTDDRNHIEYGFARTLGRKDGFKVSHLRQFGERPTGARSAAPGRSGKASACRFLQGEVHWERVECERQAIYFFSRLQAPPDEKLTPVEEAHRQMLNCHLENNWKGVVAAWRSQPGQPASMTDLAVVAHACAQLGDDQALTLIGWLRRWQPTEAELIRGILLWRQQRPDDAAAALAPAFQRLRTDPWPLRDVVVTALDTAVILAQSDRVRAARLLEAVDTPFAVGCAENARSLTAYLVAKVVDVRTAADRIAATEPNVQWTHFFLRDRRQVYEAAKHPLAARAADDLAEFVRYDVEQPPTE